MKDIECSENAQRYAACLVHEIAGLNHGEHEQFEHIQSLNKAFRGDFIENFKMITGKSNIKFKRNYRKGYF